MRLLAAPTASMASAAPWLMLPVRATRSKSDSETRSMRCRFMVSASVFLCRSVHPVGKHLILVRATSAPGPQMPPEPAVGVAGHGFEGARFLEQVGGARHNHQLH